MIKTKKELEELIKKNDKVVIDFYAEWCVPCKALSSNIEDWKSKGALDGITIEKINIEEDDEQLASIYNVRNIPFLVFFQNGQMVGKTVGNIQKDKFMEQFK